MRYLRPMPLREEYVAYIERIIMQQLAAIIYRPLLAVVNVDEVRNAATNVLVEAIESGVIRYFAGEIHGTYSAAISRELRRIGARYNGRTKTWAISPLPPELSFAVARAVNRFEKIRQRMMTKVDEIDAAQVSIAVSAYDPILKGFDNQFVESVEGRDISIPAALTPAMRAVISKDWSNNLQLYVKNWTEEATKDLRAKIEPLTLSGTRAETLATILQDNYAMSQSKAKFLARQETSLLMASYRKAKYEEIGVRRYRWSTAHDVRVRHDHALLDGEIFAYDNPPVADRRTGSRANPGVQFGCRCIDIPIID